jgi:hypothetical protein
MDGDHPTPALLEQFMCCTLVGDERRRVVRHLVAGCERCSEITRKLWALGAEKLLPLPPLPALPAAAEAPVDREAELSRRRRELLAAGLGGQAALASFELAQLYRNGDRTEDLAALAGDVLPILRTGQVSPTVGAALLVFKRLAETGGASAEFLSEAARLASPPATPTAPGTPS